MKQAKLRVMRQGDVMLIPVAEVPQKYFRKVAAMEGEDGLKVQGEGEHTHRLPGVEVWTLDLGKVDWRSLWDRPKERSEIRRLQESRAQFVVVGESKNMTHEEHPTLEVPPGIYEIRQAREYGTRGSGAAD